MKWAKTFKRRGDVVQVEKNRNDPSILTVRTRFLNEPEFILNHYFEDPAKRDKAYNLYHQKQAAEDLRLIKNLKA